MISEELLAEIDAEVGSRGRSAFFTELARKEIKRRRLLAFLTSGEPAWKDEDHPEMAGPDGVQKWVRSLRDESEKRLERADAAWNQ